MENNIPSIFERYRIILRRRKSKSFIPKDEKRIPADIHTITDSFSENDESLLIKKGKRI